MDCLLGRAQVRKLRVSFIKANPKIIVIARGSITSKQQQRRLPYNSKTKTRSKRKESRNKAWEWMLTIKTTEQ